MLFLQRARAPLTQKLDCMAIRALALCLLILPLIAATNSSRSMYSVTFPSGASPTDLVATAVTAFRANGFTGTSPRELQYGGAPIWVSVSSSKPGELDVVFTQLRGGCGNFPEVDGARSAMESVRRTLEQQFGRLGA